MNDVVQLYKKKLKIHDLLNQLDHRVTYSKIG